MVGVAVYPILLVQHLHSTLDSLSVVIVERHLNIHTNNSHYGLLRVLMFSCLHLIGKDRENNCLLVIKGSYTVYTVTVVVSCRVFDMRSFNESKTS